MRSQLTAALCALSVTLFGSAALAATISGKITDPTGAAIAGMQVRLWTPSGKGWGIAATTLGAADGTYSFSGVAEGDYKVDARMPPMFSGNYGDTWYDVAAPNSNGLIGQDADLLSVSASDVLTGINIELFIGGALATTVVSGPTNLAGIKLRLESSMDSRIHHNDETKGPCCITNPHLGRAFFRGMAPSSIASDYWLIGYDPAGVYATQVHANPITITAGNDAVDQTLSLSPIAADPQEPNGTPIAAGTPTITTFPYVPSAASVAGVDDVDFYCLDAAVGDRFVARAYSRITVGGVDRPHPWFDPMIGLWDGTQFVLTNDDAVPGQTWDAELDTRQLPAAGRYCFAVSTFGDADFDGTGQGSKGGYTFEVEIGNRSPTLEVLYEGGATPVPPAEITVSEGAPMQFTMNFTDPDMDMLAVEVRHVDTNGATVTTGVLNTMADQAVYDWTPSQTDAAGSPFTLTFRVNDGEFDLRIPVLVRVGAVSIPPTIPVPVEPIGGITVVTDSVDLVAENATDEDGDALTYEFQVEFDTPDGTPEHEASEAEGAAGTTATRLDGLVENTRVSWRVRAFDGADASAWSEWVDFFVNAENEPPAAPTIIKPGANARLDERQPTVASTIPEDPEQDPVTVTIELSNDSDFAELIATSDPIEPGTDEMMVSWLVSELLDFGGVYYLRAFATDDQGAQGPFSDVIGFSVRHERDLMPPSFSGEWAGCEQTVVEATPSEVRILNFDNSGDAVTFEVLVARAETPDEAIASGSAPQSDSIETAVSLDRAISTPGEYVLNVRAVRGDEVTEWIGCSFRIGSDGGGPDGGDNGSQSEGCGCSSAKAAPGSLFLVLLGLVGITARRRVRSSRHTR